MTDAFLRKAAEQAVMGQQVMEQAAQHVEILARLFQGPRLAWEHIDSPEHSTSFQATHGEYKLIVLRFDLEGDQGLPFAGTAVSLGKGGPLIINLPPQVAKLGFDNASKPGGPANPEVTIMA